MTFIELLVTIIDPEFRAWLLDHPELHYLMGRNDEED